MIVPERLINRRKEANMTQKQLSEIIGVEPGTVGLYEQGRRNPDIFILKNLANALNTSMDFLAGNTDNPEKLSIEQIKHLSTNKIIKLNQKIEELNWTIDDVIELLEFQAKMQNKNKQ